MPPGNGKTIVCVDCPVESSIDGTGISKLMSDRRNQAGGLYSKLREKEYNVVCLLSPSLTQLQNALSDPSVAFLTASGHGTEGSLIVGRYTDLLTAGGYYDRKVFNQKIVHIFACLTASRLGQDLVGLDLNGNAASAFIGYDATFDFAPDNLNDVKAAEKLIDCDSAIDLALSDAKSPAQAVAEARAAFNCLITNFRFDGKHGSLIPLVRHDCDALSVLPSSLYTSTPISETPQTSCPPNQEL